MAATILAQTALAAWQDPGILILLGAFGIIAMIIALVAVSTGAWVKVSQQELALKQQMVERGMSADEMVAVLSGTKPEKESLEQTVDHPCASEVVVNIDDEWQTGLVLQRSGDQFFIHLVGTEMSDNQWVTVDRVRFPATTDGRCGKAGDGSFLAEFARMATGCGNGQRAKPSGVDQDL
jgi:hypothetical protein